MTLDERQCLQDGVVNARRNLGTFLDTNPFGAFVRQLPDPGSNDKHECTHDGAGHDETTDLPLVRKMTAPASKSVTPRIGSDPPGRREPPRMATVANPATSNVAPTTAVVERPSARSSIAPAAAMRAAAPQVRHPSPYVPEGEVEEDAGATGECEEREDKTDECRIDAEACGQPPAHPGDDAVMFAALEEQRRHLAHRMARTMSTRPAPTSRRSPSRPPEPVLTSALRPSA